MRSVLSGVPQGSCLGPILYNLYVADLHLHIQSRHAFYADDTKLYGNPSSNHHTLQTDLTSIWSWCQGWLIPLNTTKCSVMHLGSNNPKLPYVLGYQPIVSCNRQSDLGIIIVPSLKWSDHISSIVRKANATVYLLRNAFSQFDVNSFKMLYPTFIRPILEYGAVIWSPYLVKDVTLLESAQRRATKMVRGLADLSYGDRLARLQLPYLSDRHRRGDLILTYRILHNNLSEDLGELFTLNTDTRLRGNALKLSREPLRTTTRQHFFPNRVFTYWNALPSEVVTAPSVSCFKNRLDTLNRAGNTA